MIIPPMPTVNISSDRLRSIVELITAKHDEMSVFILSLFSLFFAIAIVSKYMDLISSKDDNAIFPVREVFFGFCFTVFIYSLFPFIVSVILELNNFLADKIMLSDDSLGFYKEYIAKNADAQGSFNFLSLDIDRAVSAVVIWLGSIIFFVLNVWRYLMLSILFLFYPLAFSLSLLPNFGWKHIINYIVDCNQVAFWLVLKRGIDFIFKPMFSESASWGGETPYITLMLCYIVAIIFIPTIASKIVGGNNYNSPLAALAFGAAYLGRGGLTGGVKNIINKARSVGRAPGNPLSNISKADKT